MATDVRGELHQLIETALAAPRGTTTQYRPLHERLSTILGLPATSIRTKAVGDYNDLNNRLGEVVSLDGELLVLLVHRDEERVVEEMRTRLAGAFAGWRCLVFGRNS